MEKATLNPCANNTNDGNGVPVPTTGSTAAVPDDSDGVYVRGLKHKTKISLNWTREEQCLLEDLIVKYASIDRTYRYAKIATELPNKTMWDVAVRCKWMMNKGILKQKEKGKSSSGKKKHKKAKNQDQQAGTSSHATNHDNDLAYPQSQQEERQRSASSVAAIDDVSRLLLEQNALALDQISANLSNLKLDENIGLFCQTSYNILALLNKSSMYNCESSEMPEMMKPMPPLPVKLNDINELVNCMHPLETIYMRQ